MQREIQSSELRLGSIVNRKFWNPHPKTPGYLFDSCVVDRIGQEAINVKIKNGGILKCKTEYISPVPLTEEWLLRLGFKQSPSASYKFFKSKKQGDGGVILTIIHSEDKFIDYVTRTEIATVHHLQNFWHVLTLSELTTNKELINS